jgi:ParB/RepB/Spo0J family partition protein
MTVSIKTVAFENITCDEAFNSRKDYEEINELAHSIQQAGLLQPIGVTPKTRSAGIDSEYFVVYGFRRYKAICAIREKYGPDAFSEIPVVVQQGTIQELKQNNLRENLDRKSLKPHEISDAIKTMVNSGLEQRDIAARLGRPQSWVSYHFKVATKLNVPAATAFREGHMTLEQALYVADVPEAEQTEVVNSILEAETRNEARKIAKTASKKAGSRRQYVNKGRPTAKNLVQKIRDYSFDATSTGLSVASRAFYNGVTAGMRVALGDVESDAITPDEDYYDVDFGKKEEKKVKVEAAPQKPKGKRGRKKKVIEAVDTANSH